MLARLFLLLLSVLCLGGCDNFIQSEPVVENESPVQTRDFSYFDRIDINAPVNVHIHPGASSSRVVLRGDPRDLKHIKMRAKQGLLMLVLDEKQTPMKKKFPLYNSVRVDIFTKKFRALTYKGKGLVVAYGIQAPSFDLTLQNPDKTILGGNVGLHCLTMIGPGYLQVNGVNSKDLKIKMTGNPTVQLTGVANATRLELRGRSFLSFHWLKSTTLILRAYDASRIQLAGVANRLDVELWDKARLNGRFLRSEHTFVKTHGHAVAEIASVKDQHTLALDASDIYFYNLPALRTDFMATNGAVLDMRDWHLEVAQEYTDYNK